MATVSEQDRHQPQQFLETISKLPVIRATRRGLILNTIAYTAATVGAVMAGETIIRKGLESAKLEAESRIKFVDSEKVGKVVIPKGVNLRSSPEINDTNIVVKGGTHPALTVENPIIQGDPNSKDAESSWIAFPYEEKDRVYANLSVVEVPQGKLVDGKLPTKDGRKTNKPDVVEDGPRKRTIKVEKLDNPKFR